MKFQALLLCAMLISVSTAQTIEQKSLAVTVYNQNLGVIKDVRSVDLKQD